MEATDFAAPLSKWTVSNYSRHFYLPPGDGHKTTPTTLLHKKPFISEINNRKLITRTKGMGIDPNDPGTEARRRFKRWTTVALAWVDIAIAIGKGFSSLAQSSSPLEPCCKRERGREQVMALFRSKNHARKGRSSVWQGWITRPELLFIAIPPLCNE